METFQSIITALTTQNELLSNLILIPFSFIETYLNILLFTTLLNISSTKGQKIQYVLIMSILAIVTRNLIPNPYGSIINLTAGLFLIKYIFNVNFVKAFLAEIIPAIIMLILELCVSTLYRNIFCITLETTITIPIVRACTILFIYAFLFLIYKFAKHSKIALTILDNFSKKSKLLLLIDIICGFIFFAVQLYLTVFYINNVPVIITILNSLCLISYFIISLYSIINIGKLETTTNDLEREQLYNKSLAVLHDSVRGFKHDFANIVQAIGGYVDSNDMDGLRTYYNNLKRDCVSINNLTVLNPDTINNPALYSLLCSKYHKAREHDIHVDLDIFLDFKELEKLVPTYDLSRIFGILLDNAIEASKDCEYKHIILKIYRETQTNCIVIHLLNTYTNKDVNTERIFHKGYSTKDGNSGLGLWEVHKYLANHTNLDLYTTKDENYFSQELKVYNE